MYRHRIPKATVNAVRRLYINGPIEKSRTAKLFKISRDTLRNYIHEFDQIKEYYPSKLVDMDFYIPEPEKPHYPTTLYKELMLTLPGLIADEKPGVKAMPVWRKFRTLCPSGYSYSEFKNNFYKYVSKHIILEQKLLIDHMSENDYKILSKWRHSNNHRSWQIAVALNMAVAGNSVMQIMDKTEAIRKTVNGWLVIYRTQGLKGFIIAPREPSKAVAQIIQDRKDKLVKLLYQSPKLHGLNRTSWSITALTETFNKVYETPATYMQLSRCLSQLGYAYKKSRDMMTSPDPHFREKINKIQHILQKLGPKEKFFSIDEYGPVSIKIKGGKTLKHLSEAPDAIPTKQKCKGLVMCIAAIELSTNQVTHFYSLKKNSFEMIRLIDLLILQYSDQEKLFLCWDAASWHNSKILRNHIDEHNSRGKPLIELAPLPASTQFLNVIESVFAGLAKAVIHNSDYPSVEACKEAISLHFETRNQHFRKHPKRAGNKIWGKEIVAPKFSETNHCCNRRAMRGAK